MNRMRYRYQKVLLFVCLLTISWVQIVPPVAALALADRATLPTTRMAESSPTVLAPYLHQLAVQDPTDDVRVIVQMKHPDRTVEEQVRQDGGQIVNRLAIINAFVANVKAQSLLTLAQSASVRWISLDAPVRKQNSGDLQVTISDEFNQMSYAGSNGEAGWSSDWQEIGEADGAEQGNVAITPFWGGALQGLRLQGRGFGLMRALDLSTALTGELSVAYRRKELVSAEQGLTIALSTDNGTTWQTVGQINGPATDSEIQYTYLDLSAFVGSTVLLRLLTTDSLDETSKVYLDFVAVSFTPTAPMVAPAKAYLPLVNNDGPVATTTDDGMTEALVQAAAYSTVNLASTYVKAIGASRVWTEGPSYLTGNNVRIAVVDSGISEHPDLRSNGQSRIVARVNFGPASATPDDDYGHGTHVAGIMGGNGTQSNGKYMGVAPDAKFVDVRVTDDKGAGSTSNLVAGLEWILNNKNTYNIRIVNLSINSSVPDSYLTSALCAAVEILWFNGIVTVVSAGNAGVGKLNPPANDPFVITVGAVDDQGTTSISDDTLSKFSSYNITDDGFAKPDLVAPGRDIVSLLSADDNSLATNYSSNKLSGAEGAYYYKMSGTSMAAAVVTGAVAILLQKEPMLSPDQVKYRLLHTATPFVTGQSCAVGAGYLDIYAATHTNTTASANTGLKVSQLLWTGSNPVTWSSVSWNSVSWNSVSWNSVSWNSVSWNSVSWNSVSWNSNESGGANQGNCSDVSNYGLLGHWRLNESNGTSVADASGNNNLGTTLGEPKRTPAGRLNNAVLLDGVNDAVTIPSSSSLNNVTNQLTVATWLYRTTAKTGWQDIIARQYGTSSQDQFALTLKDNTYYFSLNTSNTQKLLAADTNKLNEWVHLAGVYDGSTMKLYVDGNLRATATGVTGNVRTDTKPLYFGAGATGTNPAVPSQFVAGLVDDVRVYNRALSAAEINTLADGPNSSGTPLLIYDEGLAANWVDWSWDTTRNLANTTPVLSGSRSIAVTYNYAWAALYLHANNPLSTSGYSTLRFRVRGSTNSNVWVGICVNSCTYSYFVTTYADQWVQIDVPLASFGSPSFISDVWWQNKSTTARPIFYIDQIELVP